MGKLIIGKAKSNEVAPIVSINEIIHHLLAFSLLAIVLLGVTGKGDLLDQVFHLLTPVSDWVVKNIPLIENVAKRRPDYPYAHYYLALIYIILFMLYLHKITITFFQNRNRKLINYELSTKSGYQYLCNTIYSGFSPIANPFCFSMIWVKPDKSSVVEAGGLVDGLAYYASKWGIWAIYSSVIYLVFFYLPLSESVVSGNMLLPFGFFVTFFLLAIIHMSVIFEVVILLIALLISNFKQYFRGQI